jgi:hypothetical protein
VFVVGCPRSGTTLLQRMLDRHPQLAVANDTHFIPAGLAGATPRVELPLTAEIVERVRSFRTEGGYGFQRLGLPAGTLERAARRSRTYPELVSRLYSGFAELQGKPLAGEKTPDYVRCLPLLHALFPDAKVVHLLRDGRDVTLALVEWGHDKSRPGRLRGPARSKIWRESPVAASALWWEWQVSAARRAAASLGSVYYELRYEDLVSESEATLRRLVDFLQLPFDAAMLNHHLERAPRADDPRAGESAWKPVTRGLRDWQTQMADHDVELIERLTRTLLKELHYPRAYPEFSPEIKSEAKHYRKCWTRKLARRLPGDQPAAQA